jgi:hypothetical protein
MTYLLAILLAAAQPALPPASPPRPPRPVACVLDRLDPAYLSGLWEQMEHGGIQGGAPAMQRLNDARTACAEQWRWRDRDIMFASYYAMAQGRYEALSAQRLSRAEDRDALRRAMNAFAPAHLDVLDHDPEGVPLGSSAKDAFRAHLGQVNPDLVRRSDSEILWEVARPLLVANVMNAHFALGEIMP